MRLIAPHPLLEMITGHKEIAIIDVREQGEYAAGHLLVSCCIPLSLMELKMADLVPRLETPVVLIGDEPSDPFVRTHRAFERLSQWGYSDLSVLTGGIEGWRQAGFSVFSGLNTLSKAFGEYVEATYHTPHISAEALRQKMKQGENLIVLDARPAEEYFRMNIPGSYNVPGAELVFRFFDLVKDPETLVVVNCAGRTRSIIGAQSLINAGVPNAVTALNNGTMGWHLSGFELESGQNRPAPFPTPEGIEQAKACVRRVADRFVVQPVERSMLEKWQAEGRDRTLYVLDVRSPEEYAEGHLSGSRNAPGGQLVQATDEYVAVRNARIVLVDDTEVRATMTATWLIQMGWQDVRVLAGGIGRDGCEKGAHIPRIITGYTEAQGVSAAELKAKLSAGAAAVIDVGTSRSYRNGHIPGAYWAVRARMGRDLSTLLKYELFILTAPDDRQAHLAAMDLRAVRPEASVRVLLGGLSAWTAAGFPVEKGMNKALSTVDDVLYKPYEQDGAPKKAMQQYLAWEVGLIEQIQKDGTVVFPRF